MNKIEENQLKLITALETLDYYKDTDYNINDFDITGEENDDDIMEIVNDYKSDCHTERCKNRRDSEDSEYFDDRIEMF